MLNVYAVIVFFSRYLDNRTLWQYENNGSSLRILGSSLKANVTYEFMAQLEKRDNSTTTAMGSVLVRVKDIVSQWVAVG